MKFQLLFPFFAWMNLSCFEFRRYGHEQNWVSNSTVKDSNRTVIRSYFVHNATFLLGCWDIKAYYQDTTGVLIPFFFEYLLVKLTLNSALKPCLPTISRTRYHSTVAQYGSTQQRRRNLQEVSDNLHGASSNKLLEASVTPINWLRVPCWCFAHVLFWPLPELSQQSRIPMLSCGHSCRFQSAWKTTRVQCFAAAAAAAAAASVCVCARVCMCVCVCTVQTRHFVRLR